MEEHLRKLAFGCEDGDGQEEHATQEEHAMRKEE